MIQQNKNKNNIRDKRFNDFLATNLDATLKDRFCQHCHLKLVHNPRNSPYDRYLYSCPKCNCGIVNIHQTEPGEKLVTMFPTTHNIQSATDITKKITQPDSQRLPRSTYFIQKNIQKKNELEIEDPYLTILKQNNKIRITNIDYTSPEEYDDDK